MPLERLLHRAVAARALKAGGAVDQHRQTFAHLAQVFDDHDADGASGSRPECPAVCPRCCSSGLWNATCHDSLKAVRVVPTRSRRVIGPAGRQIGMLSVTVVPAPPPDTISSVPLEPVRAPPHARQALAVTFASTCRNPTPLSTIASTSREPSRRRSISTREHPEWRAALLTASLKIRSRSRRTSTPSCTLSRRRRARRSAARCRAA